MTEAATKNYKIKSEESYTSIQTWTFIKKLFKHSFPCLFKILSSGIWTCWCIMCIVYKSIKVGMILIFNTHWSCIGIVSTSICFYIATARSTHWIISTAGLRLITILSSIKFRSCYRYRTTFCFICFLIPNRVSFNLNRLWKRNCKQHRHNYCNFYHFI